EAARKSAAGTNDPATAFKARLAALLPKIKEAIVANPQAGAAIKARASESGVFAQKRDFTKANQLLDEVERMLAGETTPPGPSGAAASPASQKPSGFRQLQTARLAWESTRKQVCDQI